MAGQARGCWCCQAAAVHKRRASPAGRLAGWLCCKELPLPTYGCAAQPPPPALGSPPRRTPSPCPSTELHPPEVLQCTFNRGCPFSLQENAIPLSIYMLGQSYTQQRQGHGPADEDPLDAAKPALCALLQRLAARDRGAPSWLLCCATRETHGVGCKGCVLRALAAAGGLQPRCCQAGRRWCSADYVDAYFPKADSGVHLMHRLAMPTPVKETAHLCHPACRGGGQHRAVWRHPCDYHLADLPVLSH